MDTYEQILHTVADLPRATSDERDVVWVGARRLVGAARSQKEQVEIFVAGPPLEARTSRVRDRLEHTRYYGSRGAEVEANRIVLPEGEHFDPVAAFLLTELLRNDVEDSPQEGFDRTEAVIALALEQASLEDQSVVGLVGELLCLHALMGASPESHAADLAECWAGHDRSARDIQLGRVGIEVKTTVGMTSTHHVQGFHQVEPGAAVDGVGETDLRLLSVGLAWLPEASEDSFSLADLVDDLAERTARSGGSPDAFLTKVHSYGLQASGYDHRAMAHLRKYRRPFGVRFARLYDLLDPQVRLLTSAAVLDQPMTVSGSVSFDIALPPVVTAPSNPLVGLSVAARALLSAAGPA